MFVKETKYEKFFCSGCGDWLGVKKCNANTNGIYPYCKRCKRQVEIAKKIHIKKTVPSAED